MTPSSSRAAKLTLAEASHDVGVIGEVIGQVVDFHFFCSPFVLSGFIIAYIYRSVKHFFEILKIFY